MLFLKNMHWNLHFWSILRAQSPWELFEKRVRRALRPPQYEIQLTQGSSVNAILLSQGSEATNLNEIEALL